MSRQPPGKFILTNRDDSFLTQEEARLLLLEPLKHGWRRELVRRPPSAQKHTKADVYYFSPDGVKLRSKRDVGQFLLDRGLNTTYSAVYNFSFSQKLFGGEFAPYESTRFIFPCENPQNNCAHRENQVALGDQNQQNFTSQNQPVVIGRPKARQGSLNQFLSEPVQIQSSGTQFQHVEKSYVADNPVKPEAIFRCICGGSLNADMIQCYNNDKCPIWWYHLRCVNLNKRPRRWFCPMCRY